MATNDIMSSQILQHLGVLNGNSLSKARFIDEGLLKVLMDPNSIHSVAGMFFFTPFLL